MTTTDLTAEEIAKLNKLSEPFKDPTRGGRDTGRSKAVAAAVREWMARQGDA